MAKKPINLLVVDWDSFFENPIDDPTTKRRDVLLFDWGHKESLFHIFGVWDSRAHGFLGNNLPLPGLTGKQDTFWNRFTFARGTKLFYGESNSSAVNYTITGKGRARRDFNEVWLYDAHHDSGYHMEDPNALADKGLFSCENWMILYSAIGARLHTRYPKWRAWALDGEPTPPIPVDRQVDDEAENSLIFNRVFVCRSGAWVPPWNNMDAAFLDFVNACPVASKTCLDADGLPPREFDLATAEREAVEERKQFDLLLKMNDELAAKASG